MNRRTMIRAGAGAVAAIALPSYARRGRSSASPIIDGNLMAPIDPDAPLDAATAAQVRSSGLTAFKMTLGGSGNQTKDETDAQIADLTKGIARNPTLFKQVVDAKDLSPASPGAIGVIYSFEAAGMLEGQIANIDHFRTAGVLVMGLSYNTQSPFASGVLAPQATGLSPLGREAVDRMNNLGITVDISHSDELSSLAALAASRRPVLITHAGCAAVHPHPRNKSDRLMRALAGKGGVIGIYELAFLVAAPAQPVLDDYLAHLVHALNVCGEDHVGIGTDGLLTPFDTSPESMKEWDADIARRKASGVGAPGEGPPPFVIGLNRPDRYAVIADALRRKGYPARITDKILGENFRRVFLQTWTTPA
ncbi:dipeptidase [Sphingomonas sp. ASY06-1R]|uniref:dipeptidase n=1 Tax=Sphingomonas sp. ASY06-1R TaxID=3445771 RepID=UPI003FA2FF7B